MTESRMMFGRKVIYTNAKRITSANVVDELNKALRVHAQNYLDIKYLYEYYRGNQPILDRVKDIRPEICNKIVENRANEIVSFKVGYLMGEPIQYVNRSGDERVSEAVNLLNEYVFAEDKACKDKELADWMMICGLGLRMVLPDKKNAKDESPFEIYTLDPRYAFVVHSNDLGEKAVMGVKYVDTDDGIVYSVYTEDSYYEILNGNIRRVDLHALQQVPIIEYPANRARLGAFEIVLPLLDAINEAASNRLDGIEQFIESFMVLKGVDIDSEDFQKIKELGGMKVPVDGDVRYLTQELNQTQSQVLADSLYQNVLTICGMPNRNGGSSTSDTGSAVELRDGWSAAESRAKDTELMFKKSEKEFLKLAIYISNIYRELGLKLSDVEIRFTRRNYENIQVKAQVLTMLLGSDKVHPKLAFEHCGLFTDSQLAYTISEQYAKDRADELAKIMSTMPKEKSEGEEDDDL